MKNFVYKIKNKIFRFSKEANKIKRPSYDELLNYRSYVKKENNKFILSFGSGRCGQNWFAKIFNSHSNWIGTCERFSDFESLYRYISFYKLPIDKEDFFQLIQLACNRDLAKYQNTLIASPYFAYGVEELSKKLNPNYLIFNIRSPLSSVESFFSKGWYLNFERNKNYNIKSPFLNISNNLTRSFSRVVPTEEFFNEWLSLTRVGKIAWFWATTNKLILEGINKIEDIDKLFLKLEDIDQNYDFYLKISNKFNFENKMSKKKFCNVINKAPNKSLLDKYEYSDWTDIEKREYQSMIDKIFPHYDDIKTNI
tara:strand:+ start:4817 stop:5746 length:930 start_codon:yes stop_codon:yes gene_type:complete